MFEFEDIERAVAKIKTLGVGGAGGNAINNMIAAHLFGIEFIALNTDTQHLDLSLAPIKIQIGSHLTKGLGAGSDPSIGRDAAMEDKDAIAGCIEGADMLFITAGMGGGTGTGASPVIASIARELGILTVGIVTRPFFYEGRKRILNAEEGIRELKRYVDTLIVVPNDRIHLVVEKNTPLLKSLAAANDVLRQAIQGITDIIMKPGLINLDFADVKAITEGGGKAVIGIGTATGEGAAREAAKRAINNPLIEQQSIEGADRILINITGGLGMPYDVLNDVGTLIHDTAHDEANIIIGTVIDPEMEDEIRVTVIAAGLEDTTEKVVMPELTKWMPRKEPVGLRGSSRLLNKHFAMPSAGETRTPEPSPEVEREGEPAVTMAPEPEVGEAAEDPSAEPATPQPETIPPAEDPYDIPAYLRKKR